MKLYSFIRLFCLLAYSLLLLACNNNDDATPDSGLAPEGQMIATIDGEAWNSGVVVGVVDNNFSPSMLTITGSDNTTLGGRGDILILPSIDMAITLADLLGGTGDEGTLNLWYKGHATDLNYFWWPKNISDKFLVDQQGNSRYLHSSSFIEAIFNWYRYKNK